ncbi:hypothetical protein SAJA_14000 [Salinisphaera japonica YTM-1]|uniref:Uncharacterized protein n=1 Tax=Salinisphaera japonica YTM-1 TaxID=1209778 RepID=A0A423PFH8_9GAMM|nr:hypothetical protein SAJA_14000 [Salinisphaera japonica YTM-1]
MIALVYEMAFESFFQVIKVEFGNEFVQTVFTGLTLDSQI